MWHLIIFNVNWKSTFTSPQRKMRYVLFAYRTLRTKTLRTPNTSNLSPSVSRKSGPVEKKSRNTSGPKTEVYNGQWTLRSRDTSYPERHYYLPWGLIHLIVQCCSAYMFITLHMHILSHTFWTEVSGHFGPKTEVFNGHFRPSKKVRHFEPKMSGPTCPGPEMSQDRSVWLPVIF